MLLREFDQGQDFVADLENILNLYIKKYDSENSVAKISYETLNTLLQRAGSYGSVNQKIIGDAVGQSDSLEQLIQNYDGDGITLNTRAQSPETPGKEEPNLAKTDQGITATTQQAASRAASKGLDSY